MLRADENGQKINIKDRVTKLNDAQLKAIKPVFLNQINTFTTK